MQLGVCRSKESSLGNWPLASGSMRIDRNVLAAVGRKRGFSPVCPPVLDLQAGQPGHEIEFRRPDIAQLHRIQPDSLRTQHKMLGRNLLLDRVKPRSIEPHLVHVHLDCPDILQPVVTRQIRNKGFDHKDARRAEVLGYILEATNLPGSANHRMC